MAKVGVLTIGQAPRTDVTPSVQNILGTDGEIIERGGLDRLTADQLHTIAPDDGDVTYISRLRNGAAVKIGKKKLLPLLQAELSALESEADVVLMLCTGHFPTLTCSKPIIYPDKILTSTVQAVLTDGTLGLIIPLEEQKHSLAEKWEATGLQLEIEAASPYEQSDLYGSAKKLKQRGAELIVLDCMGYNETHKQEAKAGSNLPVLLSRTLAARIIKEYVS